MSKFLGFLLLYLLCTGCVRCATYLDVELLLKNLTDRTNKDIRPSWDQSQQTVIYTSFAMISLQDINEVEGTVSMSGFFSFTWHDFTLMWNPANYGGIDNVEMPVSDIWKPTIVNGNAAKNLRGIPSEGFVARVENSGLLSFYPGDTFTFTCDIDSSFFPFDTQKCNMDVVAWGYSQRQIFFHMNTGTVDLDLTSQNGEWILSNATMTSVVFGALQIPGLTIEFTLKRRSTFFVASLILPVEFLGLLNIFVFILPQDSGERIGFSITALLALVVFLTIAQNILPATATPTLAYLCIFLLQSIAISGFIVFSVILSSWLYHRADDKAIPRLLSRFVKFSIFDCCKKKKMNEINVCDHNQMKTTNADLEQFNRKRKTQNESNILERNQIKVPITELEKINNDITTDTTWKNVSQRFDSMSFWFYFIWFVEANIKFIADSMRAP